MKKLQCFFAFCLTAILLPAVSYSQYILNGSATQEACNCFLLTQTNQFQSGSVWQSTKINLNNPFDFSFNVNLGCLAVDGADGIVFILQPNITSIGSNGHGLGFQGIVPSIGISLDTYQNLDDNDPAYDHISIQANGNIVHGSDLADPIPASSQSDNIEDCNWHILRIKWDPVTHTLSTYFDGVFRLSTQTDIVATIFNNDPLVYWGFSAATGSFFNYQKFCTALNPNFAFAGNDTLVIPNTPFQLHGSGGDFYSWWPATGLSNSKISNPVGNVTDDIKYLLTVSTREGCTDTASVRVTVFKVSAIYVPTGFTPNNDGRNDILKPAYTGIKSLSYFTIYSRWGQKVFSTNNLNIGWDGSLNGGNFDSDSFVWILKATDIAGKVYIMKGSFMLIR